MAFQDCDLRRYVFQALEAFAADDRIGEKLASQREIVALTMESLDGEHRKDRP